ncbi:3-isopropylmalate dehydratase small subunit [Pelagerythrobacter sp.]|uniref:3-isopropylmalate dehydratase small subunit n=1 Tax=Pelagerythrobacter sp. TaxID=2800702 RepID=UPI0035B034E3
MRAFRCETGIAAAIPRANVDTDAIVPSRFLKTVSRHGLGEALFHERRYGGDGEPDLDFVLNREPWTRAKFLVALENFGSGSSREHAVWALADFGIRCVVAATFAEIFANNCCKNGILPVSLPRERIDRLMELAQSAATAKLTIDLERCAITDASGEAISFDIDPVRRNALLSGLDEISETERLLPRIVAHEDRRAYPLPPIEAI